MSAEATHFFINFFWFIIGILFGVGLMALRGPQMVAGRPSRGSAMKLHGLTKEGPLKGRN